MRGGEGAEIVYSLRNDSTLAQEILNNIGDTGQIKRKIYQRRLPENPNKDYYYILRETNVSEPLLIEYGFIDNANDANKLRNNLNDYAEAVVKAIVEYLNLGYDKTDSNNIYTVKSGDSLWSISKKLGVSVEELKLANNLSSNLLSIGQKLMIPKKEEITESDEYDIYVVKQGDSLYSIANNFGLSVNDLIEYNNLSTTSLSIGQQLLIPKKQDSNYDTYVVKSGDSLYSLANQFGVTVNELKQANNLSSNLLSIGQKLIIPTEAATNENIYTVQIGDNLYSIARRYNTTVSEIKRLNNLNNEILSIGQKLIIPPQNSQNTYVVKSGDNLYSIARRYNTTVSEIKLKNNLTSNLLNVGQVLVI